MSTLPPPLLKSQDALRSGHVRGRSRHVNCGQHVAIGTLSLPIHHLNGIGSCPNHTLDRGPYEDIAQQLLAVRPHHDEISRRTPRCPYDAIESFSGRDFYVTTNVAQFGERGDVLVQ